LEGLKNNWVKSSTLRNIILVYGGDVFSKILIIATTLILIRVMSISDYAFYIAFTSIASISSSLVGGGINSALIRFSADIYSRTGNKPVGLNSLSLLVQISLFLLISLVVFLFPTQIARLALGQPEYANLIVISMVLGFGTILINAGQSMLQAEEKFRLYVVLFWIINGTTLLAVLVLWLKSALVFTFVAWTIALIHIALGLSLIHYLCTLTLFE
jgi:O-antigen/teichoic acid export membrane protein